MKTKASGERLIVVKVGGDVLEDEAERRGLGKNVKGLVLDGCRVVVLHGGGPQVTKLQERLGLEVKKVAGRRVTSEADLRVIYQAICGEVNVGLTLALLEAGVNAFGCHGASGRMVRAVKRPPTKVAGHEVPVDFGEVGDVASIDAALIRGLCQQGLVPVIATLGVTAEGGRAFNINADTTAVQLAIALGAEALLMVTKVGGVFRDIADPTTLYSRLSRDEARALIAGGVISGGMIPKIEEALYALDEGVGSIVIVDAGSVSAFAHALTGSRGTKIA